jgi:hypothetical protein
MVMTIFEDDWLFLSSMVRPSYCQDPLELRGPEGEQSELKAGAAYWFFSSSPGAKTAGGFSVPLGLEWHKKDMNFYCATWQPCTLEF